LKNIHPGLPRLLLEARNSIISRTEGKTPELLKKVTNGGIQGRVDVLKTRLKYMVDLMNENVVQNICVSNDVKSTLKMFGVREDKLLVQHIGSLVAEMQTEFPHDLHNPIVFGNIGGVAYYKGTHVLVDAVRKVKKRNFVVKIFGKYDPRYRDKIMLDNQDLPIEYCGRYQLDELQDILNEIDVMVLPSICKDTAPQTIFESFSARIPAITSDIGGFPDFIQDGVNGFRFNLGDSQDLANKIENLLAEPEKIKIFGKNIPQLKTIKQNAHELLRLYKTHKKEN
jgi:glycosyltransferase involved in cell wall biosynthesis